MLALGAVLLSIGATIGALLAVPNSSDDSAIWNGHRTVLVEVGIPETEVLSALYAAGFKRVISESTQPVLVTDWAELESMTLASALHRLVATDPRRDPYIDELTKWFSASVDGKAYRALYLPVAGAVFPEKRLIEVLSSLPGKFYLPDGASVSKLGRSARRLNFYISCSILLVSCILSVSKQRHLSVKPARRTLLRYLLRAALAAPWICLAAAGMPAAAIATLFGVTLIDIARAFDLPFEELLRSRSPRSAFDSFRRQTQVSPLLIATAAFALVLTPEVALSASLALLGSACAALAAIIAAVPLQTAGRSAFVPKPIRAAGLKFAPPSRAQAGLACVAISLWALSSFAVSPRHVGAVGAAVLPRPLRVEGSAKPYAAEARSRIGSGIGDRLPDLADWLAHIAAQEALPLERIGARRTDAFESVSISRPDGDVDLIVFDDAWARGAYRKISADSIEGMLAAQGRAIGAASGSETGKGRPLAPIRVLRYILLLVPPLCGIAAGYWVSRVSTASGTRQEA